MSLGWKCPDCGRSYGECAKFGCTTSVPAHDHPSHAADRNTNRPTDAEILAKLPKTADGVRVVPGEDKVYKIVEMSFWTGEGRKMTPPEYHIEHCLVESWIDEPYCGHAVESGEVLKCYWSLEAASAALAKLLEKP